MTISTRKITGFMSLALFLTLFTSMAAADPAQPPPPPPPEPPSGVSSSSYAPVTTIKSCNTDFDSSTNQLEYCNEPYRQTKTKNIYYCESNGNGQYDSWETAGDWDNPTPSCGSGDSFNLLRTQQKDYRTCGKVDAEDNPGVNSTTSVDDNEWFCPSTKALSKRHESGELDTGIGISGTGYSNLDTMSYRSDSNMSYNVLAAVPACVNRVPMINLNVEMEDPYSGDTTGKTGVYAAHMNLYYGPTGSNGQLKEVDLPEQDAFRRQYDVDINSRSYRMWAWRQRFAGAVQESVNSQNLQLPEDADVGQIAEDYRDRGKSVGDLWLSSDFLYGAEAGDPNTRTTEITRRINSTCTVDTTQIDEKNFDSTSEFVDFTENNEEEAVDILGKSGGNYCSLGTNDTMTDITGSEPTGGSKLVYEELTGSVSTKILDNETGELDGSVDVRDLDATFINSNGQEEQVTTGYDFSYYYSNDKDQATQEMIDAKSDWSTSTDVSMKEMTDIRDLQNPGRENGNLDASVDVRDLDATFTNESDQEEEVNSSQEFMDYLDQSESEAKQEILDSEVNWSSDTDLDQKTFDNLRSVSEQGTYQVEFKVDYVRYTRDVTFKADFTRYMTGSDFEDHSNSYIEAQLEKHVYGEDNDPSTALKPVSRFEDKQITVDGVLSSTRSGSYTGEMLLETAENVAKDKAYVYYTYEKTEIAKKSWNWRALQGVSMTTLAKCMYNWDQCMLNKRNLPNEGYDGTEVTDAGYGPWEKTNTFSWSTTAAETKGENLQDVVDDTNFYNQSVEVNFDKYYDGARGSNSKEGTPVNVYRKCTADQGWRSDEGEFYVNNHFICPTSDASNNEASSDPSKAYRCAAGSAQLPVESASEYDAKKLNGDWYVCRTMSPGKWYEDQGKPDVYVQKEEGEETEFANVACTDEIATCDESTYRMKIYDPGEQPLECPTEYSEYETQEGRVEIGSHKYVCAAAKDKVGKEGYSVQPVEFGSEDVDNIDTRLAYPSTSLKMPYGESTRLFYSITNNANEYRQVKIDLGGINATFVGGSESKTFTMIENETREFEIEVTPAVPGEGTFWVETTDETVGYKLNSTLQVNAPSSVGGVSQEGDQNEVPGVGLIHLVILAMASTYFFIFRN